MIRREEEILQVANENYSGYPERRLGFIAGAEYADRTMLKKVCEFFEPRLIAFIGKEDAEELIAVFRQAMEGE